MDSKDNENVHQPPMFIPSVPHYGPIYGYMPILSQVPYPHANFMYFPPDSSNLTAFFSTHITCPCQAMHSKPNAHSNFAPNFSHSPESAKVSMIPFGINPHTELSQQTNTNLQFTSNKIKHLRCLFNLLVKIFLNSRIEFEDVKLTQIESCILVQILRRKFPNLTITTNFDAKVDSEDLFNLVERAKIERSNKRIEENIKFVYKHSMKHLKGQFVSGNSDASPSTELENFYKHYFSEVATKNKVPFENFHDQLNSRRKGNQKGAKTLNSEYLNLLFSSQSFLKDLKEYLVSTQLIIDYQKNIRKKFEKMLLKWERMLEERSDSRILRGQVNDYFLKNKQCKLPWTSNEIISSINYFLTNVKEFEM